MFDISKVANNIKAARTKKNMTQMDLADEMGVSYQAVSNWERSNSMPDISRLQELCTILDISFEDLVGEKNQETETVEKFMSNEEAEISFSTLIGLAPFMDKKLLDELAKKVSSIDIGELCGLAPFLKKETLDNIVDKAIKEDKLDINIIIGLAPFLSKKTIKKITDRVKSF